MCGRARARRASKGPLTGRRILLAEDEALIGFHLKRILEDFGCEAVGPMGSVDGVLESALHGKFDGALLDVNLRSRQIFEILPTLQKLGMRIILASGYDDETLFPPAYRAMPRIAKPFSEKELLSICEKTFAAPSRTSVARAGARRFKEGSRGCASIPPRSGGRRASSGASLSRRSPVFPDSTPRLVQRDAAGADGVRKACLDAVFPVGLGPRFEPQIARIVGSAAERERDDVVELEAALVRFGQAAFPKLVELDRIRDLERRPDGFRPASHADRLVNVLLRHVGIEREVRGMRIRGQGQERNDE